MQERTLVFSVQEQGQLTSISLKGRFVLKIRKLDEDLEGDREQPHGSSFDFPWLGSHMCPEQITGVDR